MAAIRIDGKTLEGGGQVLRVAIACGAIQGRTVTVHNIRGKRPKPGLAAQHLNGLQMVSSVCGGQLRGAELKSMEVTLTPRHIRPGSYFADTETAGSVMLLLQAVLPCVLYAGGPTQLTLKGGTNAEMAPPVDYTSTVFAHVAKKFGVQFRLDVEKRGFYPRGGGCVKATIQGLTRPLQPVTLLDRGKVLSVGGVCYLSGLPSHLANTAVSVAIQTLQQEAKLSSDVTINITTELVPDHLFTGKGFGMLLYCETDTGLILGSSSQSSAGNKKKGQPPTPAAEIGHSAAHGLASHILQGVCVDNEMQNQVILLMGLASGRSSILCGEPSLHTQTVIEIMQQTTQAKFSVEQEGALYRIVCDGIGLDPNNMPCTT